MEFFDDKNKSVTKWNRNYFYLGTVILVTLNIFIFELCKSLEVRHEDNLSRSYP